MVSDDGLKEFDIINRAWYYFDDIFEIEHFDFTNTLLNEKWYVNILIFDVSYKTLIVA